MKNILVLLITSIYALNVFGQNSFDYSIKFDPINIPNLPGLHSYVYAQDNGKWLVIGGRKDGIHARQPFNSFPQSQNNTDIYVIDINEGKFWTTSLNVLPAFINEQLQSTNMNFYQDEDTLYIIGGYAYSTTANDHITFPNLTTVNVPGLINAIITGTTFVSYFKQISDNVFAVTGGHLKKMNNTFYLVGGQRFDGSYNPMGNPTFTQEYTNQIRMFRIDNSGSQLNFSNYTTITDPIHLRRRDYNLLPQIFPDGEPGFTISSGVFQINADLPFLYPVDIKASGYYPVTTFNQYLSNYHSAVACLYDSTLNEMHSVFFGGISQYYYQNGVLIQDNLVPFVKTVSRLTRDSTGNLFEYQLPVEMPGLKGAGAEFIYNKKLPHYDNKVIRLSAIQEDSILIGHIYGGILSPTLNPFATNQTGTTSADPSIYAVWLIRKNPLSNSDMIDGKNPYDVIIYPNPYDHTFFIEFNLERPTGVSYFITNNLGQIIYKKVFAEKLTGAQKLSFTSEDQTTQYIMVTFIFDDKYYVTKKIITP